MNFIELTNMTGEKNIINIDCIVAVFPQKTDDGIIIMLHNGNYTFRESYEKLKNILLPFYEINFGGINEAMNCADGEIEVTE